MSDDLIVGNYRLVRLEERGAVIDTYQGEHTRTGAVATLKVFQQHMQGSAEETFRREAQRLAQLTHPQLVRVLDFDVREGRAFLVQEPLPISLRRLYPVGAQLPLAQVITYAGQIGRVLQYAHEQSFIHGSLRPECLFLRQQDKSLALSELGITSLALALGLRPAQPGPYAAPEQARGIFQPAGDQYALSRIIYEWLSGQQPGAALQPLREKAPGLPAMLEPVLRMALAVQPAQRFSSVRDFLTALEQAGGSAAVSAQPQQPATSSGERTLVAPTAVAAAQPGQPAQTSSQLPPQPLQAQPPTPLPYQGQPSQPGGFPLPPPGTPFQPGTFPQPATTSGGGISRRGLLIGLGAGGAGLLALGIGGGLALWKLRGNQGAAPPAQLPPTLVWSQDVHLFLDTTILWSPDGRQLAGWTEDQLIVVNTANGQQITAWKPPGSTDIQWVQETLLAAYIDKKYVFHVLDVIKNSEITTYTAYSQHDYADVNYFAWSPDGTRLAAVGGSIDAPPEYLRVWNARSSADICAFHPPVVGGSDDDAQVAATLTAIRWSPDGKRILTWGYNGVLYVVDAQSGAVIASYRKHFEEHVNESSSIQVFVHQAFWSPDGRYVASQGSGQRNDDVTIHVWDAQSGSPVTLYTGHAGQKTVAMAWSPDSKLIASKSADKMIHVWQVATGKRLFIRADSTTTPLAWRPGSARLASDGEGKVDNSVFQVWDATSGAHVLNYIASSGDSSYTSPADIISFSPDGRLVAASNGESLFVWKGGW